MLKIILLYIHFLLIFSAVRSQTTTELFMNANWEIVKKDRAAYRRLSSYDLNNIKLDGEVLDYNVYDTLIMSGNYSYGKRNGIFTFYFSSGNIKSQGEYKFGKRIGVWKYFYNNKVLKARINFSKNTAVLEYNDRNSNPMISNGTGNWLQDSIPIIYLDRPNSTDFEKITGKFKNGLIHGTWKRVRLSDAKILSEEVYSKGKFRSGALLMPNSNSYGQISRTLMDKFPDENSMKFHVTESFKIDPKSYPNINESSSLELRFETVTKNKINIENRNARYLYGNSELLKGVALNIRFPRAAKGHKGTVYVGITINSKGERKNVHLVRGVQKDLDVEAMRVVSLFYDWTPAIRKGKAIESTITIPIRFE